jgi:hypothetical protein
MIHYIDLKSFSIEVVILTQGESLKLVATPIKLKKKKMNSNKKNFVL